MSFSETIFLFFLALIIFGPKKLPEMARQAGRILAELRRASNEFKSQIETEISHLEVQQRENERKETEKEIAEVTTGAAPQGAIASLSLNPANEIPSQNSSATLAAAPGAENSTVPVAPGASAPPAEDSISSSGQPAEAVAITGSSSQASHV